MIRVSFSNCLKVLSLVAQKTHRSKGTRGVASWRNETMGQGLQNNFEN